MVRGDGVAVEGKTECVVGERLTVAPQVVAFPVADPWLETEVGEARGRMAMVLNVSGEAATARVCYSRGTVVGRPEKGGEPERVCTETERVQIPPFGTRMVPLEREGNTRFFVQAKGRAVVLRVLVPMAGRSGTSRWIRRFGLGKWCGSSVGPEKEGRRMGTPPAGVVTGPRSGYRCVCR